MFVERKTHQDTWTGDVSVKERFTIKEEQVLPLLRGEYPVEEEVIRFLSSFDALRISSCWTMFASSLNCAQRCLCHTTQAHAAASALSTDIC